MPLEELFFSVVLFFVLSIIDDWIRIKTWPTGIGRKEDALRGLVILY